MGSGASLADCTITFISNGGSGSMSAVTVKAGSNYALPECGFTAPERGTFHAWEINSTAYRAGDSYQVNESIEVKVVWRVVEPTTYQVTVTDDGNGTSTATSGTAAAGTEIVLSATAKGVSLQGVAGGRRRRHQYQQRRQVHHAGGKCDRKGGVPGAQLWRLADR